MLPALEVVAPSIRPSSPMPASAPAADGDLAGLRGSFDIWAQKLADENGDGKVLGEQVQLGRWTTAVGRWLIDATLLADVPSLEHALRALQDAAARLRPDGPVARLDAVLHAFAEIAVAGLDRTEQTVIADTLDPGSWAAKMLVLAYQNPHITSSDIGTRLAVHEAQISRSGKALEERGLVVKTRHGRAKGWYATPRGETVAKRLVARASK
ncbi:MarR family transcriptional regulator [Amycolatopsis sp. NPDC059657]|uniref:MarR family transcriptional regulator n=1 Tax=Amycolatopsis sp. NPDC059657 TaxID=3346899 RepID=UPI003670B237